LGVGIKDVDQIANRFGPVVFRAPARNQHMTPTGFGFQKDKDIPRARRIYS
jgi:hypothetical protein